MISARPYEPMLAAIQSDRRNAGEVVRAGASEDAIRQMISDVHASYGIAVPEAYLDFLRVSDGLMYNGLVLYSSTDTEAHPGEGGFWQGMIEANSIWRGSPANKNLLVLGDDDLDIFAWAPERRAFIQADRIGRDREIVHPSCEAMIEAALAARL